MDALAAAAIEPITSGMVVGLGTGRAAARAVRALGERAARERLSLTCVSTSRATSALAESLGLRVTGLNDVERVDYLFDGADEVDDGLSMIKGGGAAMTRERIVARACLDSGGACVYLIDETKLSPRLGAKRAVPVEVLPMARQSVLRALGRRGLSCVLRTGEGGAPAITDNGGEVLDATLPEALSVAHALPDLAAEIKALPGVVDHGLFLTECRAMLIERAFGAQVERRVR